MKDWMRSGFVPQVVSFVSVLLLGCSGHPSGGGSGGGGTTPSPAQFCQSLCGRAETCDNTTDLETCTNACTNGIASFLPKLRGDVVDDVEGCFAAKDCATILGGSAMTACIAEASASVAPSAAATSFCADAAKAYAQCGASLDQAGCLNSAKIYNDATLAGADACMTKACTAIDACTSATLGDSSGGSADAGDQ